MIEFQVGSGVMRVKDLSCRCRAGRTSMWSTNLLESLRVQMAVYGGARWLLGGVQKASWGLGWKALQGHELCLSGLANVILAEAKVNDDYSGNAPNPAVVQGSEMVKGIDS